MAQGKDNIRFLDLEDPTIENRIIGEGAHRIARCEKNINGEYVIKMYPITERDKEASKGEHDVCLRFDHPHIRKIFSYTPHDGSIEVEAIPGVTLGEYIDFFGPLGEKPMPQKEYLYQILKVIEQSACALIHAQEKGISVHGDIKPGNILVYFDRKDPRNIIYPSVCDWEGALVIESGAARPKTYAAQYVAPEITNQLSASHKSDVYSLGVLLITAFHGNDPFEDAIDACKEYENPKKEFIAHAKACQKTALGLIDSNKIVRNVVKPYYQEVARLTVTTNITPRLTLEQLAKKCLEIRKELRGFNYITASKTRQLFYNNLL